MLKLQSRSSQADTALVDLLRMSTKKKRSHRLYYTDLGSLAAYKCITKGLSFEHSVEYLAIGLVKMRSWEMIGLTY